MDTAKINLNNIFGEEGLLAGQLLRYEYRPHQIKMAEAVEESLLQQKHLIIEADTGVGKSLAYLVPSVLWALETKNKIVISTNTINLQEQLLNKDLPLLRNIMPDDFSAVLIKGRSNYLCLRRFNRLVEDEESLLVPSGDKRQVNKLKKWIEKTQDGSLADLPVSPDPGLWGEICSQLDNCMGKKCGFYKACFLQNIRRKVFSADILIVNHHLFFSDIALKQVASGILPAYGAAILDEAHFIEEIATEHLGFEISNLGIKYLLNKLYNPKRNKGILLFLRIGEGIKLVKELHVLNEEFFGALSSEFDKLNNNILRLKEPGLLNDKLDVHFQELHNELKKIRKKIESEDLKLEISAYIRRIGELIEKLNIFRNQLLLGHVYWIELEGGRFNKIALRAFPVEIGHYLKDLLFGSVKTVVLTGATLSINGSFDYIRGRLWLEDALEIRLGSSFDYENQMKIYVPKDISSPDIENSYKEDLIQKIIKYLGYSGGKAFVLFTNYKLMKDVYRRVEPLLSGKGIKSFIQGGGLQRSVMLDMFRQDKHSVLFGTDSFWTGVDVEGETLSNVIITRLPFAVPDHPLVRARIDYIEEHGGNAFRDYSLPQAIIKLRQGVGRLIRSRDDRGIIVILDNRIITRPYGRGFWDSLPKCPKIIE